MTERQTGWTLRIISAVLAGAVLVVYVCSYLSKGAIRVGDSTYASMRGTLLVLQDGGGEYHVPELPVAVVLLIPWFYWVADRLVEWFRR